MKWRKIHLWDDSDEENEQTHLDKILIRILVVLVRYMYVYILAKKLVDDHERTLIVRFAGVRGVILPKKVILKRLIIDFLCILEMFWGG